MHNKGMSTISPPEEHRGAGENISRRQFLKKVGGGALAVVGITGLVAPLIPPNQPQKETASSTNRLKVIRPEQFEQFTFERIPFDESHISLGWHQLNANPNIGLYGAQIDMSPYFESVQAGNNLPIEVQLDIATSTGAWLATSSKANIQTIARNIRTQREHNKIQNDFLGYINPIVSGKTPWDENGVAFQQEFGDIPPIGIVYKMEPNSVLRAGIFTEFNHSRVGSDGLPEIVTERFYHAEFNIEINSEILEYLTPIESRNEYTPPVPPPNYPSGMEQQRA